MVVNRFYVGITHSLGEILIAYPIWVTGKLHIACSSFDWSFGSDREVSSLSGPLLTFPSGLHYRNIDAAEGTYLLKLERIGKLTETQ